VQTQQTQPVEESSRNLPGEEPGALFESWASVTNNDGLNQEWKICDLCAQYLSISYDYSVRFVILILEGGF